jgi:hypothetical protein
MPASIKLLKRRYSVSFKGATVSSSPMPNPLQGLPK